MDNFTRITNVMLGLFIMLVVFMVTVYPWAVGMIITINNILGVSL